MQAASTFNIRSIDPPTTSASRLDDPPRSTSTSARLRPDAYSSPRPSGPSINDAQSSPSSFGPDTYASSWSTPMPSATSSTLRPPPGLPIPSHLRPPPLRRDGYQPYRFGHLAFKYIEDEMKRNNVDPNGNNGST